MWEEPLGFPFLSKIETRRDKQSWYTATCKTINIIETTCRHVYKADHTAIKESNAQSFKTAIILYQIHENKQINPCVLCYDVLCQHERTSERFVYNNVVVKNNATLTIKDKIHCYNGVSITLRGGKLVVDNGQLLNANVLTDLNSLSDITIKNGGVIERQKYKDFTIPIGSTMQINNGEIK